MLKLLFPQATFLLLIFTGHTTSLIDFDVYVPFLTDMQEYYKSTGIVFVYDDKIDIFESLTNNGCFIKRLSKMNILCQSMNYSMIREKSGKSRNLQNLFVVFVYSQIIYDDFRLATEEHDMSYHTWLVIFMDSEHTREDGVCQRPPGNPFNLVFNSRMIVKCHADDWISKWYSLNGNQTEVLHLAKWNRGLGINHKNKDYYENRYDLQGKTIRAATNTPSTVNANKRIMNLLQNILEELQNIMNFKIDIVYEDDRNGQWDNQTKRWDGLMGYLKNNKVDILTIPVAITSLRLDYIDFTAPLILSKRMIYLKQPDGTMIQWSAYFKVFSWAAWSTLFLLLFAATLVTTTIRHIKNAMGISLLMDRHLVDNLMLVLGISCNQGMPEFPTSTPLRLAYISILLLMVIIGAVYSASITSYLTFLSPALPFSDTEGFVKDGSYKLIVIQNSTYQEMVLSGTDAVLAKFRPLLKDVDMLPADAYSGFLQVCNERVGFYTSEAALKGVSAYIPCSLTYIETGQFECIAMALRKRSPYTTSINYNLMKMEGNGIMQKLRKWYFEKLDSGNPSTLTAVGIYEVLPLVTIFASGLILASLILLLESYLNRLTKKKIDKLKKRQHAFYHKKW